MRQLLPILFLLAACSETGLTPEVDEEVPIEEDPVAALRLEPREIDFGAVEAGERADALVTVFNDGDAPLEVTGVDFVADGAERFRFDALDGMSVDPGGSAQWSVSYVPETLTQDVDTADLAFRTTDPAEPEAVVALSGTTLLPTFTLTPAAHDFGVLDVGASASHTFTLTNTSDVRGDITALDFTATSAALSLTDDGGIGAGTTVLAGESIPLVVTYAPTEAVGDEGTLTLSTNAPDTPELAAFVEGEGFAKDVEVEVFLTADDAWTGFIDGVEITGPNQADWTRGDTFTRTWGPGEHVIAIKANDVGSVISGFIAVVRVDGVIVAKTGDGVWKMTDATPASGWNDVGFDDSGWDTAAKCSDPGTWGTYWPRDFYADGAEWVWWTSACRDLRQAWFRLVIEV